MNRRQQGDLGEISSVDWLIRSGANVFLPLGHSPDIDLVAEFESRLFRIQVKTSTCVERTNSGQPRYCVHVATFGGNRSWTGTVKHLDPAKFDFLFVLTGDGRRWLIPSHCIEARRTLRLGGPKYSEFEIDPGLPFEQLVYGSESGPLKSASAPGEYRSGQTGGAVNAMALPSQVRILPPPLPAPKSPDLGTGPMGQTRIWGKRRVTLPRRPLEAAGLDVGDRLRVSTVGPGRVVLERIVTDPSRDEPATIEANAR